MKAYRKPLIVEATQFTEEMMTKGPQYWPAGVVPSSLQHGTPRDAMHGREYWPAGAPTVATAKGVKPVRIGDWIILEEPGGEVQLHDPADGDITEMYVFLDESGGGAPEGTVAALTIEILRRLHRLDSRAAASLARGRIPVNKQVAADPDLVVDDAGEIEILNGLGFLGILNGILSVAGEPYRVAAIYNREDGAFPFLGFELIELPSEKEQDGG